MNNDQNKLNEALSNMTRKEATELLPEALKWAREWSHKKNSSGYFLLTQNKKLAKGDGLGWNAYGVELASGKRSGHVVCQRAVEQKLECLKYCIVTSGNGRFKNVRAARVRKTKMLFDNPRLFVSLLCFDMDMADLETRSQGLQVAIRLNVFSDLDWLSMVPWLFESYSAVQFYDYTKQPERLETTVDNYHITLSQNESLTDTQMIEWLASGQNVAVVFQVTKKEDIPSEWLGFPVISGDENDFRFMDTPGVVVGLIAKGKATHTKKDQSLATSSFVHSVDSPLSFSV